LPDGSVIPGITRASDAARQAAVQDGTRGLRKVMDGHADDLTPAEQVGLEAIIVLEGRPPLFIQHGDFLRVPEKWRVLNDHREQIRSSIARVGRIEVTGHPSFEWIGTGFLAGPEAVITNRHVANEFARADGAGWRFQADMSATLDFNEEHGALEPLEFEITGIVGIHERHDLAVLSIAATGGPGSALPDPLTVAAAKPGRVTDREVYVIGYPAWDGRRNDPTYMRQIFDGIYDVKRLQPGLVSAWTDGQDVFRHDCSTLGGNSGSPVFDLETHAVVGLHFGGRYLIGNNAVPLWRLADDALLRAGGVNFG
jgi:V8-like Glu-specific endopeptidase